MKQPVDGHEVYHWPEFKALCKRLGIPWELPTTALTIRIPADGIVTVTHEYQGEASDEGKPAVTTSRHDEPLRVRRA